MEVIVKFTQEGAEELKKSVVGATDEVKELGNALDASKKKLSEMPQSGKEFNKLQNEIKATEVVMEELGKSTISAKTQLKNMNKDMVDLRVAMEKLKSEGKQDTEIFKNLEKAFNSTKKEAAFLKDTILDVGDEIKRAASDTNRLDVALRTISVGVSVFGGLQGAAALFGGENEKLEKTLVKINGVMLIAQSLQQVQNELTQKDSVFKLAAAKANDIYALAVGKGSTAMKIFRGVFVSLGIGALMVGLGLAIKYVSNNWDRLASGFKEFYQNTAVKVVNAWIAVRNKFTKEDKPFVTVDTLFPKTKSVEEKAKDTGVKIGKSYTKAVKETIEADTSSMLDVMRKQLQVLEKELEIVISTKVSEKSFINELRLQIIALRNEIGNVEEEIKNLFISPDELIPIKAGDIENKAEQTYRIYKDGINKTVAKDTSKNGALDFFGINEQNKTEAKILAVFDKYVEIQKKFTDVIVNGAQVRADAELFAARDRFQKGITSEKQFLREQAKIQNDFAKKKRRAEIAEATAQIPIAALNAFTQTNGGIFIRTLAAAAATAFALAKVIQLKKAPLPKFAKGGIIEGVSHGQGGVNIEAEGGEYIVNKKSVRKYRGYRNINPIEAINKGVFENYFQPKIVNKNSVDIGGVVAELKFVGEYIKQGNRERMKQGEKLGKYFGNSIRT